MHILIHHIRRFYIKLHYLSFFRIINLSNLVLSYLFSYIGIQKFQNRLPYFISIEPANFCNLQCPECPVGNKELPIPPHSKFDIQIYKKLVDELKPTLLHIIFYFQGEPFINNQLNELINYAHKARLFTSTSTNGQFLTDKRAKEIVLSGLDKLIVSVDGSTQEVYETYRVGGNLQITLDGIKRIVAWKKELNSATPLIDIQFLVLKTNEHQMEDMKRLVKSIGADRLTFKTAQLYDFENGNKLLTTKNKYARYRLRKDGKYQIKGRQPNHCWRLWSGSVLNTQGEVLPCCFDKKSKFSFGNIQENSFSKTWHNVSASGFRGKILQNRKQLEMCKNCTSK